MSINAAVYITNATHLFSVDTNSGKSTFDEHVVYTFEEHTDYVAGTIDLDTGTFYGIYDIQYLFKIALKTKPTPTTLTLFDKSFFSLGWDKESLNLFGVRRLIQSKPLDSGIYVAYVNFSTGHSKVVSHSFPNQSSNNFNSVYNSVNKNYYNAFSKILHSVSTRDDEDTSYHNLNYPSQYGNLVQISWHRNSPDNIILGAIADSTPGTLYVLSFSVSKATVTSLFNVNVLGPKLSEKQIPILRTDGHLLYLLDCTTNGDIFMSTLSIFDLKGKQQKTGTFKGDTCNNDMLLY